MKVSGLLSCLLLISSLFFCAYGLTPDNDANTQTTQTYQRGLRILTLDGGGARGLIEIEALRQLSINIYNDSTGATFFKKFDLVGGTSAGGVISFALGRGSTLDHIEKIFANFSIRTFPNKLVNESTVYNTTEYVDVLKDGLTSTTIAKDVPKNIFVTSVRIEVDPWVTYLLTTYNPNTNVLSSDPEDKINFLPNSRFLPIYVHVQATTAVPTYFDPVMTSCGFPIIDGAVRHNNPTLVAIQEAQRKWPGRKIDLIVSLGTGRTDIRTNTTGMPPEIAALFDLPFNSQQTHIDTLVKLEEEMPDTVYHRFNLHKESASIIAIDEMDFTKLEWLKNETRKYMNTPSRLAATRRIRRALA